MYTFLPNLESSKQECARVLCIFRFVDFILSLSRHVRSTKYERIIGLGLPITSIDCMIVKVYAR